MPPERQRSLFERYKVWFIAAGLVIVVTATGISSLGEDDDSSSSGGSSDSDLLPAHKEMVDTLAADGDCDSLQARFDDAYDARGTPGTDKHKRNPALMNYADDAMRRIDCY